MQFAIEAYGITKRFPLMSGWKGLLGRSSLGPSVVDHVDVLVREGEIFGLVGPNGAGKTTLIKILTTLILPSSGSIRIAGYDIQQEKEVKNAIGLATSDERSFYWRLTGRQNLQFFANLHNLPARYSNKRIDELFSQVGLQQVSDKRFHTYSTGMRQKLAIARALLNEPRVLFMDEPTKGLDPLATKQFQRLIREQLIDNQGITVFLTSHYLTEVEKICDRIAVMNKGKIQACGTMAELKNLLGPIEKYRVEVEDLESEIASRIAEGDPEIHSAKLAQDRILFEFDNDHTNDRLANLITSVQVNKGKIKSVSCNPVSLDAIFEHLTDKPEVEKPAESTVRNQPIAAGTNFGSPLQREKISLHISEDSNSDIIQPRLSAWIGSLTRIASALVKRDVVSETSYRFSFYMQIVEMFMTVTILFFLSQLVGQHTINQYLVPYGNNYFTFAIIGVAFYGYFNVGSSIFAEKMREAQTTGTLEAMVSTPAGLSTIVLASSIWGFIMTTLRVVLILGTGALILDSGVKLNNYPLVLLILGLTLASASSFGIISTCFTIVFKRGDPVGWLFRAASWLLGGVVFPVGILPIWMQKLALLLPTTHALHAMRLVLLQGKSINDLLPEIGALCVFCFLLMPISLRMLAYSVRRAKNEGSLTHY